MLKVLLDGVDSGVSNDDDDDDEVINAAAVS
jgi:hypothetical protein